MQTKSDKGSAVGLVVGLVLVGLVTSFVISVKGKPETRTEVPAKTTASQIEEIIFIAEFEPTERNQKNPVQVIMTLNGVDTTETVTHSPFTRGGPQLRGSKASMMVGQPRDGLIRCAIAVNGEIVSRNERHDAGSVRCYHNHPGR